MKCAICGEEIITDRLVAYDHERQIVTRVYPHTSLDRSTKLRELEREENTTLSFGEPYIVEGDRAYHVRCYQGKRGR